MGSEGFPLAAFSDPPRQTLAQRNPALLEGGALGEASLPVYPIPGPELLVPDRHIEGEDAGNTCSSLKCLSGLRKWENSSVSETVDEPLEMEGSIFSESNNSEYQEHLDEREATGGTVGSALYSELWWAKVFATIGAILAGLTIAILLGVLRIPLWNIVSSGRKAFDSARRSTTPVPEIIVSPPPGDLLDEPEVAPLTVEEKSLPPLPEIVQLESAHVQEPVRVDVEGPEGGRATESDVAVVIIPVIPQLQTEAQEEDWVLPEVPEAPPAQVHPEENTKVPSEESDVPTPFLTASSGDQPETNDTEVKDTTLISPPDEVVLTEETRPEEPPIEAPLQAISEPASPETEQPLENAQEEDLDPEAEADSGNTQLENKKKKNRTRSRAKKKKAAFAREVEEREKEKEREKVDRGKRAADRVIDKVVMEIESEKRVMPVQPVSSLTVSEEVLGMFILPLPTHR